MATLYVFTTKPLGEANNYIVVNTYPLDSPGPSFANSSYVLEDLVRNEVEVEHDLVANGFFSVDFNETNDGFIVTEPSYRPKGNT